MVFVWIRIRLSNAMSYYNAFLFLLLLICASQLLWDWKAVEVIPIKTDKFDRPLFNVLEQADDDDDDESLPQPLSQRTPTTGSTRISYTMHPKTPDSPFLYQNKFHEHYDCQSPLLPKRQPLPDALKQAFNYTTTVSTDLNILFMGDSVGLQFAQAFDEVAGVTAENRERLREYNYKMEGLTIAGPLRGGGIAAGWRITGMLTRWGENKPLPYAYGGGWTRNDTTALFRHRFFKNASSTITASSYTHLTNIGKATKNRQGQHFDSVIFRIPHGWLKLKEITKKSMSETVQLARELFGVSSVIFVSMPFVNNVLTMKDIKDLERANLDLHTFVNEYNANTSSLLASNGNSTGSGNRVQHVMVLEFGRFTDELMQLNARVMGYDTSNTAVYKNNNRMSNKWNNSIPFVCGQRPAPNNNTACRRNLLTFDGIHWCMETLSGRVTAGIACLLGCAHNNDHETINKNGSSDCERRCNDEFMSLIETQ